MLQFVSSYQQCMLCVICLVYNHFNILFFLKKKSNKNIRKRIIVLLDITV